MKKILYLSYDGLTDPLGQSQILPYILGLSNKGYIFTIVSFEKKENRDRQPIIKSILDKKGIDWEHIQYTKKPPIISTIWDITRLRKRCVRLHREKKFDLIHCRSYITSLIGLTMQVRFNLKFVFDMRGFWADERIDGGIWNIQNPIYKIIYLYFKKKELQFLLKSDYTISLTYAGKEVIEREIINGSNSNIQVIPCCVDTAHFNPAKVETTLKSTLGINEDEFVLGYIGSIGTWYMLKEMLSFFKAFLKTKPNAIFLFITYEDKAFIKNAFKNAGVDPSKLRVQKATREEVPTYISMFDWSIFFIKPLFSKQASSPTKQGEIMSMGKPLICNTHIGDTDQIVTKYQSGILVHGFEQEDYQIAIDQILKFEYNATDLRKGAKEHFGLNAGLDSYAEVYESCFV